MKNKDNRFSKMRALIFDLDGTLIDSKLDLALSVNAMLDHMGSPQHVHETIFGFVGNGAEVLVRKSLGEGATDEEVKRGLAYFLSYYRTHMLDNTVLYPGVQEALDEFRRQETIFDGGIYQQAGEFQPGDYRRAELCRIVLLRSMAGTVSKERSPIRWALKFCCAT